MSVFIKALVNSEMAIPVKAVFHNMSENSPIRQKIGMITDVKWCDGTVSEGIKHCGCAYLVQDNGRNILVDTGMGDCSKIIDIRMRRGDKFYLREVSTIQAKLAEMNLKPEDIDIVINTHLHWDHCGGNSYFTKAKFYIPEADIPLALSAPCWAPHFFPEMRNCLTNIIDRAVLVKESIQITDQISVIRLGGHTPGSLGVLINTEDRGVIALAGDVVCKYDNLELDWIGPAGNIWNISELVDSIRKLRSLSDEIVPSHDWRIFDRYPDGVITTK
jgi:glyoxylase-like metal-dependent hydrolase (beta-lactamase superfamily II)